MKLNLPIIGLLTLATTASLGMGRAIAQTSYEFNGLYDSTASFSPLDEEELPLLREVLPPEFREGIPTEIIETLPEEFQANLPPLSSEYPEFLLNSPADISEIALEGTLVEEENPEDVFGLTQFVSQAYGLQIPIAFDENNNPTVVLSIFRGDPAEFGLPELPRRTDRYFDNSSDNTLFGVASDQAVFNFNNGTVSGFGTIDIFNGDGIFEHARGEITFTQNDTFEPGGPLIGQAELDYSVVAPVPEPSTVGGTLLIALLSWRFKNKR